MRRGCRGRSTGAVIVGGYVNGLGLVRALGARNIPTAVLTTKPYDIAHRSRWVTNHEAVLDVEEQPERLVEVLERHARDWSGWAVFPTNDGALAALAQHHDRLSSTYRLIAPPGDVAPYFVDKARMLELAREVGVDLPRTYGPAEEATVVRSEMRFPVVVKPNVGYRFFSRFGRKLFAASNPSELSGCIAQFAAAGMAGEVFDFVPGPDTQIYAYCTYIDARGEPRGGVTVHKLRQNPALFGVARVAEVVADNRNLCEATIEMLRRMHFRGFAAAEFKLDPRDGCFRFLEVNGRSVVYNELLRRAGLDLVGLAWSEHMREQPEAAQPNGWPGVWVHLHADLLYSAFYHRREQLGWSDFAAPYKRTKVFAVWCVADPLPFVTQWARSARAGASLLRQGKYRDPMSEPPHPLTGTLRCDV